MILWWGKKKDKDPKTGETPIEPLSEDGAADAGAPPQADTETLIPPIDVLPAEAVKSTSDEAPAAEKKPMFGGLFGGGKTEDVQPARASQEDTPPLPDMAATPDPEPEPEPETTAQTPLSEPVAPPAPEASPETPPEAPPEPTALADASAIAPEPSPEVQVSADDPIAQPQPPGFFTKLTQGLRRSSSKLADGVSSVFTKRKLDDDALEALEDLLISSDLGAGVAARVAASVAQDRFDKDVTDGEIKSALAEEIASVLRPREELVDFSDGPTPRIVLFVGVNGSGKTTTIGKIAAKLSGQGANILLAAGDTFRAAAVEQLKVWSERAGAGFLSRPPGADSAGLAYDAVAQARSEARDLVLIDTAGRLQNRAELMDELAKVIRAIRKIDQDAPHDVILVLDATVGQNALSQVDAFRHTAGVTGLVMTKLDGTAKGGVLVAIADTYDLPIHFVGVGEKAEDLHPFSADAFAKALVGLEETTA